VARTFHHCDAHIFIGATGIAVRTIAPHLKSKTADPAVVVLDHHGRFVISLLSGHLGGANALAGTIADLVDGTPVITTATDVEGVPAIDVLARECGLVIGNPKRIRDVNGALVEGRSVAVRDPEDRLGLSQRTDLDRFFVRDFNAGSGESTPGPGVVVDVHAAGARPELVLHPRVLSVGIGCRRGVTEEQVTHALQTVLKEHGLAFGAVAGLASVDLKADENGLLLAAGTLGLDIYFYSVEDLKDMDVPNPSRRVEQHIGVRSVCEAAALKRAGKQTLLVPKQIVGAVTVAVAG
jgi:cobalamin biosynthesis protein CbiG